MIRFIRWCDTTTLRRNFWRRVAPQLSHGEAPASAETELFASLGPSRGKHLGGAEKDMFFLLNERVKLSNLWNQLLFRYVLFVHYCFCFFWETWRGFLYSSPCERDLSSSWSIYFPAVKDEAGWMPQDLMVYHGVSPIGLTSWHKQQGTQHDTTASFR